MAVRKLKGSELRLSISGLGFSDTSELAGRAVSWIGQERAEKAARFGLSIPQPDYNLFVLGEAGSGRSSLLKGLLREVAGEKPEAPDLCFLHNFDSPERPSFLWLDPGRGRELRHGLAEFVENLQKEVPRALSSQPCKLASDRITKQYREKESVAYSKLSRFAETHHFALKREEGRLVFTALGENGQVMLEEEVLTLPVEKRRALDSAEELLRKEIQNFLEAMHPEEKEMNDALQKLKIDTARPVIASEAVKLEIFLSFVHDREKYASYLDRLVSNLIDNLHIFEENSEREEREEWLSRLRINLVVDNSGTTGAPVVIEDNPQHHSLFGSLDYQVENDVLVTDFTRIRAGSLFRANGGFLMLHADDLLRDPVVWEKLRRFLRSGLAHIEEPGASASAISAISLEPEPVPLKVRIVLIGSREEYYELEEIDQDFMRHFRVKVDFAESVPGSPDSHSAASILIANVAMEHALPHFSSDAVALALEDAHRRIGDKEMLSARFSHLEMLVLESAALCGKRKGDRVERIDVEEALAMRRQRHDYPEMELRRAAAKGDLLIELKGKRSGQINGLTLIDFGDYAFGFPVRVSATAISGRGGVLNIEREVELSGPNHDKGVFILQSYLGSLFSHIAPLSLDASLVFEQEYGGVEGDSASLAELYALLSILSGCPMTQSIAVTGAIDMHGEVMPVGGINEKIEGFFNLCQDAGLDGTHGVIVPGRNSRHLMLEKNVVEAVERGAFHIHAIDHAMEGVALLTGVSAGEMKPCYPPDSILGRAEKALSEYRKRYIASRGVTPP